MKTKCIRNLVAAMLLASAAFIGQAQGVNFSGIEVEKPMSDEEFQKRVQASFGFLSAREPELNPAEYAILEKFVPFLEEDPEFALTMIEGLSGNNEDLTASFDFILANLYIQADRLEDAEKAYKIAIEKYPDYLRAWRALGLLYMNNNDTENGLKAMTKAIQLGDSDPLTFGQIAYAFYVKQEYLSALSAYTQAILYEPDNENWRKGKIATLTALKDYGQANIILRDLVRRNARRADYWMELANNWVRLDEPSKAAACLEFLRGAGIENEDSLEMLGALYVNEKLNEQAAEVYLSMLEKGYKPSGSSLLKCAARLRDNERVSTADRLLNAFLEGVTDLSESERVAVIRYRSQLAEDEEDYERARDLIRDALELEPEDGDSLIALGRIEYYLGNSEESFIALGQAEQIDSVYNESVVMQAQMLAEKREYQAASQLLEEALLKGGNEWVRLYYEKIKLQASKAELDRLALSHLLSE